MVIQESKAEKLLGIISVVFGLLLAFAIIPWQIDIVETAAWYNQPRFFPYVISGMFAVLGALLFMSGIKKKDKPNQETYTLDLTGGKMVLITLGIVGVYVLALAFLPYIPCTIVGLGILMWIFGQRNLKVVIPVSIVLPIIIYLSFTYLLKLRLP
ncbi:MAG: tripartite tricarboxylate transporter TctB family protein [Oscillospiraceae bacterium]